MKMERLANATIEKRAEAFRQSALRVNLDPKVVEKDCWLCWAMKMILVLTIYGLNMTFKGGSSLSKACDIIKRFSEDQTIGHRKPEQ